ncbi:MAG: hypothetical protein QM730_01610 [Anaerolineales bacterium]
MKQVLLAFMVLLLATIACAPSPALTDAKAIVTTFVDESGSGTMSESYSPLPDTLVIATWNQHGHMNREVKFTDSNGHANFSVSYTHFFDVSVFPPCGYYSTSPLHRDMKGEEKAEFGFWQSALSDGSATVKVLLWKDLNANDARDPQEEVTGEKISVMFKIPNGTNGNPYDTDNFVQDSADGWYNIPLGNSCGTIYLLLLNPDTATRSVSEPGKDSDAGAHGNTLYPAIEIPYGTGETTVYWEIK